MNKEVYLVGKYYWDDFEPLGVFSKREDAEAYIEQQKALTNHKDFSVKPVDLLDDIVENFRPVMYSYTVRYNFRKGKWEKTNIKTTSFICEDVKPSTKILDYRSENSLSSINKVEIEVVTFDKNKSAVLECIQRRFDEYIKEHP